MKDYDFQQFWNVHTGACYIPWDVFGQPPFLLNSLTNGSSIDLSTIPPGKFPIVFLQCSYFPSE